jgi:hypothetical protein
MAGGELFGQRMDRGPYNGHGMDRWRALRTGARGEGQVGGPYIVLLLTRKPNTPLYAFITGRGKGEGGSEEMNGSVTRV